MLKRLDLHDSICTKLLQFKIVRIGTNSQSGPIHMFIRFPTRLMQLIDIVRRLSAFYDNLPMFTDRQVANIDATEVSKIIIDDDWFTKQVSFNRQRHTTMCLLHLPTGGNKKKHA